MSKMTDTFDCSRDRHLFGPGPKRILALDGGGVRGAITVAFLERIEALISENQKRKRAEGSHHDRDEDEEQKVRLGDWFDLVGGTSTGAIISGAIALGYRAMDIKDFYLKLAPRVFRRTYARVPGIRARYNAEALLEEIVAIVKDRELGSDDLTTGLCVVTKRMDTGSPWIVANNPRAPYWETEPPDPTNNKKGHIGNKHYKLAHLVRASTAAPFYFDPELIPIIENESHGLFVDGGVTPHNNPSLVLFLMSVLKPYGLCWPLGPANLTIVSIGTGSSRNQLLAEDLGFIAPAATLAYRALLSLMNDAQTFVLAQMQWLGQSLSPWWINREWGTLSDNALPGGPFFRFLRYDVQLEVKWLADNLNLNYSESEVRRLRSIDDANIIPEIYDIARHAAEMKVRPEHWIS
jgi:predicted acylesterase/phospholipase RssA